MEQHNKYAYFKLGVGLKLHCREGSKDLQRVATPLYSTVCSISFLQGWLPLTVYSSESCGRTLDALTELPEIPLRWL